MIESNALIFRFEVGDLIKPDRCVAASAVRKQYCLSGACALVVDFCSV
jgi:hypothetical protein